MSGDTDRLARMEEWARMRGRGEPVAADVLSLVEIAKAARLATTVNDGTPYGREQFAGAMFALRAALSALDGDAA